jgi:hypothetical protein
MSLNNPNHDKHDAKENKNTQNTAVANTGDGITSPGSCTLDQIMRQWYVDSQTTYQKLKEHQELVNRIQQEMIIAIHRGLVGVTVDIQCDRDWLHVWKRVDAVNMRCCVMEIGKEDITVMQSVSERSYKSMSYNHQSPDEMEKMYSFLFGVIRNTDSTAASGPVGF